MAKFCVYAAGRVRDGGEQVKRQCVRGVDFFGKVRYTSRVSTEWTMYVVGYRSLVARLAHNQKVAGSNPAPTTKFVRLQV